MKNFLVSLLVSVLLLTSVFASSRPPRPGQVIIKNPAEASAGLYQAWRGKRKAAAGNYARPEAVDKLFSVRRRAMKFKGCQKLNRNDFECIYEDRKNDISLAMIVKIYRAGYRVASVSFSSEAI